MSDHSQAVEAAMKHIHDRPCGCYDRVCDTCKMARWIERQAKTAPRPSCDEPGTVDAEKCREFVKKCMDVGFVLGRGNRSSNSYRQQSEFVESLTAELSAMLADRTGEGDDGAVIDGPYINIRRVVIDRKYNPKYGDEKVCECGHSYYRHFDTYEDMYDIGCKYCDCRDFKPIPLPGIPNTAKGK